MKITKFIRSLSKRAKIVTGVFATLAVLAIPAVVIAGYGPNGGDRTIFDFSNPAQREGAFDAPRFNSYINTNVYGDERAFLDTKECTTNGAACYQNGVAGGYQDVQTVTPGKEYIVRAYVHNIANPSINDNTATAAPLDGIGVAKNTRIRFELPTGIANGFTAQARISADNSIPTMVYDTVDFKNDNQRYSVEYIPGSAYIFNASHTSGLPLSDNIVGANGTLIGDDVMNGVLPGCFEYSAFVVVRVKIKAPDLEIQKLVSKVEMPAMSDTSESVSIKRGEKVSWRINFKNNGTDRAEDVTVRDQLPAGVTIVPGSIKLTNADGTQTLPDTALGSGGVNTGNYTANGNGVIRFTTVVNPDPDVCELTNIGSVRGKNISERSDTAKVVITDCKPPVVRCDSLTASAVLVKPGQVINFTANATAQNATINSYTFKVNGTTVQSTSSNTYAFTQSNEGTYAVSVVVNTSAGDVTSDACAKTVKVEAEKVVRCDALNATKLTLKKGEVSVFSAQATAVNTTISGYIFSVNGKVVQDEAKNTFAYTADAKGTFVVSATVKSPIGNVTSETCVKNIDVVEEIVPIYRCDAFTLSKYELKTGEEVTATVRITAKDGAEFKLATFTFGDEKEASDYFVTNELKNGVVTAKNIYSKDGNYTARVKLEFMVNGEKKIIDDAKCGANLVVKTDQVKGVTTLPKTGAGSVAGLMALVTVAGAFAHRQLTLKRNR